MSDGSSPGELARSAVRFRLVHYLYAAVVLATSLILFGANGLLAATAAMVVWSLVFSSTSRVRTLLLLALPLSVVSCCLLLPGWGHHRSTYDRMECSNKLKQIAIALHNYHDTYKTFPPAFIADADGKPMHSWRTLIIPLIESSPIPWDYDFDQPWDSPHNLQFAGEFAGERRRNYACPVHGRHTDEPLTSYVAVVGPGTAWQGSKAMSRADFVDGTSNTLFVLEVDSPTIHWMEPRDVSYEEAKKLMTANHNLNSPHRFESFLYSYDSGRQAAIADASVRFLEDGLPPHIAQGILLRNDGPLPDGYENELDARPQLRVENCIRLAVFVLTALWPLPWVWIDPHGTTLISPAEPLQAD